MEREREREMEMKRMNTCTVSKLQDNPYSVSWGRPSSLVCSGLPRFFKKLPPSHDSEHKESSTIHVCETLSFDDWDHQYFALSLTAFYCFQRKKSMEKLECDL